MQKKEKYCKVQSEYVPWTSADLTLTSQDRSLCYSQQALVPGITGTLKELFHLSYLLLLPIHASQLHLPLLVLASGCCDISSAEQWSLSELKMYVG